MKAKPSIAEAIRHQCGVERSAGGRSRQPRSQQAASRCHGFGQRFGSSEDEASHPEPQDSDGQVVMAPGPTQVDSNEESQLNQSSEAVVAVQTDSGARHHG